MVAETGLAAGFALVLVAPAELIESTEMLGILIALMAGMPIALPAAPTELAEILELVGPLTGLAGLVQLVQLTEPPVETPVGLVVGLAGLVGHPYSRR